MRRNGRTIGQLPRARWCVHRLDFDLARGNPDSVLRSNVSFSIRVPLLLPVSWPYLVVQGPHPAPPLCLNTPTSSFA